MKAWKDDPLNLSQRFANAVNAVIREKEQSFFASGIWEPREGAYQRSYRTETRYTTPDDYIDADYRIVEVEPLALPDGTRE